VNAGLNIGPEGIVLKRELANIMRKSYSLLYSLIPLSRCSQLILLDDPLSIPGDTVLLSGG